MRLSDVVERAISILGARIEGRDSKGVRISYLGKGILIGWRDSTGPVHKRLLEGWLEPGVEEHHFLAMGWFPDDVKAWVLSRRGPKNVNLYQLGLRDYFQEVERVEIASKMEGEVQEALIRALKGADLRVEFSKCRYCESRAVTSCEVCGAILCSRHAMRCPVCGAVTCHPDTGRCFFVHAHG